MDAWSQLSGVQGVSSTGVATSCAIGLQQSEKDTIMKSQITCKLDSIADKETEIIDLFAVCDMEYFEYDFQIYTQVEEDGGS